MADRPRYVLVQETDLQRLQNKVNALYEDGYYAAYGGPQVAVVPGRIKRIGDMEQSDDPTVLYLQAVTRGHPDTHTLVSALAFDFQDVRKLTMEELVNRARDIFGLKPEFLEENKRPPGV